MSSLSAYLGAPGTGKTFAALRRAYVLKQTTGKRLFVLDCGGADNFAEMPSTVRADNPRDVLKKLFAPRSIDAMCVYTPQSEKEYDSLLGVMRGMKNVIVMIDELAFFGLTPELKKAGRTYRHAGLELIMTAQNVTRDLASEAVSWSPELFLFRQTAVPNLDFCERYLQLPREYMQSLRNFAAVHLANGYQMREKVIFGVDGDVVNRSAVGT